MLKDNYKYKEILGQNFWMILVLLWESNNQKKSISKLWLFEISIMQGLQESMRKNQIKFSNNQTPLCVCVCFLFNFFIPVSFLFDSFLICWFFFIFFHIISYSLFFYFFLDFKIFWYFSFSLFFHFLVLCPIPWPQNLFKLFKGSSSPSLF